jgi:hypothetical protein
MNMFYILLPPSQPSPKGEGAKHPFPLGGNKKEGFNSKDQCFYVTEILKYNIAIGTGATELVQVLLLIVGVNKRIQVKLSKQVH